MTTIKLDNVTKIYDRNIVALNSINLDIKGGELCVVLGPSGAGKSTLLRIIAGLEHPTEGKVYFDNTDVTTTAPQERDIAMIFQHFTLYPHMTVYQNLAFSLKVRKCPKPYIDTKVREVASYLGIAHLLRRRPRSLSGGEAQRVAIGKAIIRNPRVFLLDEPLANIDLPRKEEIKRLILKLHREKRYTMVYVTHNQDEGMSVAERLVIIKDGEIQQIGTPMDVYNAPANLFVAKFVGKPKINLFRGQIRGNVFETHRLRWVLPQEYPSCEAIIGIRPENVEVAPSGDWRVEDVEYEGRDVLLHLTNGQHTLRVRSTATRSYRVGDRLGVINRISKYAIFSPDTGRLITVYPKVQ